VGPDEGDPYETTRASYDRVAQRYADKRRDRTAVEGDLDRFASLLSPGSLVLDVGCGPGFDGAILRERGLRVVGLDRSTGMLRSGLDPWPGPRVQADMRALPVRARIDGIWASASLLHLERRDVPAALAGFRRVLAPAGRLYLSVKGGSGGAWDEKPYGLDAPRWFTYWTGDALDAVLDAAGFDVTERLDDRPGRGGAQYWVVRMARVRSA